jgi:hypothetical protein
MKKVFSDDVFLALGNLIREVVRDETKDFVKKEDLTGIGELVEIAIEEKAVTKEEFEERFKHLPTKDEFYNAEARLMKELKAIREEQAVTSHILSSHEDRISRIEVHLDLPELD